MSFRLTKFCSLLCILMISHEQLLMEYVSIVMLRMDFEKSNVKVTQNKFMNFYIDSDVRKNIEKPHLE